MYSTIPSPSALQFCLDVDELPPAARVGLSEDLESLVLFVSIDQSGCRDGEGPNGRRRHTSVIGVRDYSTDLMRMVKVQVPHLVRRGCRLDGMCLRQDT